MEAVEDRSKTFDFISLGLWCLSLITVAVRLLSLKHKHDADALGTLLAAVAVLLTNSRPVFDRFRSRSERDKPREIGFAPRHPDGSARKVNNLTFSLANGLSGGSVGGGISGLIIGTVYYAQARAGGQNNDVSWTTAILLTFVYASLVGAVVGASTQLLISLFRRLRDDKGYPALIFNDLVGGVAGGLVGGPLVGVLGVMLFADAGGPKLQPGLLVGVTALVGAIPLVLSVVLYEYREKVRSLVPSLVTVSLAAPPMAALTTFLFLAEKINFSAGTIAEGILSGLNIGLMLGSLVGIVVFVNRSLAARTAMSN